MDPQQAADLALNADAALAASTPEPALQAAIAAQRPDLLIDLNTNPYLYPDLRTWLAQRMGSPTPSSAASVGGWPTAGAGFAGTTPVAGAAGPVAFGEASAAGASGFGEDSASAMTVGTTPGAGVGLVPEAVAAPSQGGTSTGNKVLVGIIVLLVIALIAGVAGLAYLKMRQDSEPVSGAASVGGSVGSSAAVEQKGPVTVCDKAPTGAVTDAESAANAVTLTARVTPACESGDILAGKVAFTIQGGSATYAMGTVQLSKPLEIPAGGRDLRLSLDAQAVYASTDELKAEGVKVLIEPDRSEKAAPVKQPNSAALDVAVTDSMDEGSANAAALAALQRQAQVDSEIVRDKVDGFWVPQLSSKREGMTLGGQVWSARDVWKHYRTTLATYPKALLLYSDNWSVFDAGGHWWVIVVNQTFSSSEAANGWCDAQGIGKEDCFAKFLKEGASSKGTTVVRK